MRFRVITLICGFIMVMALLSGCGGGGDREPRYIVSGQVVNTLGTPPAGVELALTRAYSVTVAVPVQADGRFTSPGMRPGAYTLVGRQMLNGAPVCIECGSVTVSAADVVVPRVIVPVAHDLVSLGRPANAALALFARNSSGQLMPALVQIDGGVAFSDTKVPILMPNVAAGNRMVTVTVGGQSFTRTNVTFTTGTITVLNVDVGQLSASFSVSGTVADSTGNPVANAKAVLTHSGTSMAQATTLADGSFSFTGVQPGIYSVVVSKTVNGASRTQTSPAFSVIAADVRIPQMTVPAGEWVEILTIPIVLMGDSVTVGVCQGVRENETYAAVLEATLKGKGYRVAITRSAAGGETTTGGIARLDQLIAQRPAYVTIMYGINDSHINWGAEEPLVSLTQYGNNLTTIVRRLRAANIRPVLLTSNPLSPYGSATTAEAARPPYSTYGDINFMLLRFVEEVKRVGEAEGVPVLDIYEVLIVLGVQHDATQAYLTDGIHPNPACHRIIAGVLEEYFRHELTPVTASRLGSRQRARSSSR